MDISGIVPGTQAFIDHTSISGYLDIPGYLDISGIVPGTQAFIDHTAHGRSTPATIVPPSFVKPETKEETVGLN